MARNIISLIAGLVLLIGFTNVMNAQPPQSEGSGIPTYVVIQFHSEHRCVTCLKIEELTKQTLTSFPAIPFKLINVDDAQQ